MPTRILILGGGGREHALAWKLSAEPGVNEIFVGPGSAAIAAEPRVRQLPDLDPLDGEAVVAAARSIAAELVVIGPEAPLAAGVADALSEARIAVFGPSAAAAQIETSKAWCHEIAAAAGVPMARAGAFAEIDPAIAFARALDAEGRGIVVKADGLAAGKGVTVAAGLDEAIAATRAVLAQPAGRVVIEERLSGREASCIAICDGRDALALPIARDHKRLGEGDSGPNTGGMGAYSPLQDLPDEAADEIVQRFHRPILAELARRGSPFVGALYAGIMLTAEGPRLLECNARLGDPETQVILPRLAAPWARSCSPRRAGGCSTRPGPGHSTVPACRSCRAPRSASSWLPRAIPTGPGAAIRSAASMPPPPAERSSSTLARVTSRGTVTRPPVAGS